MTDLQYIIFFFFFMGAVAYFFVFLLRLKQDYLLKIISRSLLKQQITSGGEGFFCEPILRKAVKVLSGSKKSEKALNQLLSGKTAAAEKELRAKGYLLEEMALQAHIQPENVIPHLEKFVKKYPQNQMALTVLAELYFFSGRTDAGRRILDMIHLKKASRYISGIYWYWQSRFYMREGDMQSASQACTRAEKYFLRDKDFYAAARSYLLMGTIYRVCFIDDVASFMFRGALKIYQQLKYTAGQAVVYGCLGMLNSVSEHFDEAEAYFNQAKDLYAQENIIIGQAEILNQLGLLNILREDYKSAEENLRAAEALHKKISSVSGLALNAELFSYLAVGRKDDKSSLRYARKAEKLYAEAKNDTALLESRYLQAEALFRMEEDTKAEKILRQIIDDAQKHPTSFHIANAYSLLGLSFMRRGDLLRAKGLFQQSLGLEQKNDRWIGQACDYANIGLLEWRGGKTEQARTHLQAAYDLAVSLDDDSLAKDIQTYLDKLKA